MYLNSSPPSAAYMRQWSGSALVQVIACCLFSTKPLPKPMLAYCQLDYWEQISVKIIFIQENAFETEVCQSGGHFVQGELTWALTRVNIQVRILR